jgi:tRNA-dihydrouridine synthase
MRKNLAWYIKGIPGAAALRSRLVRAENVSDIEKIVKEYPCGL